MTPEQVSALSDTELNRAMIWLYPREDFLWEDSIGTVLIDYMSTVLVLDYLGDWSLLMPLAVEHNLQIDLYQNSKTGEVTAFSVMGHFAGIDKNPLRAICECLVLIALADHS